MKHFLKGAAIGFADAMRHAGITSTNPIIADGILHRAHVEGDRAGSRNLAYVLHIDGAPAGWFQNFKTGIVGTWSASGKREPMTEIMRKQIQFAKEVRSKERAKAQQEVAQKASWIWEQATIIATLKTGARRHQYLITKRVKPHGARLYGKALVIPLVNQSGAILNLQFIQSDGTKRFLSGGRKKGCYSTLGEVTETILICEGWATGASLHESTGHYVVVALDAGNLKPVAEIVRGQHPKAEIIIAGDNDESGIGQLKAREAALACGGKYILPILVGTDWNDQLTLGGL
jgi:putative DNA primase/helicase